MVKKTKKNPLTMSLGGVSLSQRTLLARHLAIMLKSGLSITEALHIVQDSAHGTLKFVLDNVSRSVTAGRSFADALSDHKKVFSGLFVSAVRAGEVSGTLETNLEHLALQLEKDRAVISKVKGALIYPIIVLIATLVLGLVIAFFVLPQITPLFTGLRMELPITTQWLIAFSKLVEQHGTVLLVGVIGGIIFLAWLLKRRFIRPYTHWFFLRIPIVKQITQAANLARFSRTLGMLLKSGLRIDEALDIMKQTLENFYYKSAMQELGIRVTKGSALHEILDQYPILFPSVLVHMVRVGEESGKLEDTLLYLGEYYEAEVDSATKALSTVIEPALLIFIGLAVAFLALSIITPIYNITGGVKK
ncbi:MAG: type II secretion system F family protein [Patescibacteria group bacterium]|mgnify:CR=1 FL=1